MGYRRIARYGDPSCGLAFLCIFGTLGLITGTAFSAVKTVANKDATAASAGAAYIGALVWIAKKSRDDLNVENC